MTTIICHFLWSRLSY